jgi:hypothetical protein
VITLISLSVGVLIYMYIFIYLSIYLFLLVPVDLFVIRKISLSKYFIFLDGWSVFGNFRAVKYGMPVIGAPTVLSMSSFHWNC